MVSRLVNQQIPNLFIVNLKVAHFNYKIMFVVTSNFLENLIDGSRDDASIFKVWSGSIHCECLSGSSLAVANDSPVVSVGDSLDDVLGAEAEDVLLGGVVHYFIKFEFPGFLLVVYEPATRVFRNVNGNVL